MNLKTEIKTNEDPMDHIQSFYLSAGNNGCYAFCIIKAAKKWLRANGALVRAYETHFEKALVEGIQFGWIDFNFKDYSDSNNFFVNSPDEFMSYLIGHKCTVSKAERDYKALPGEIEIDFWAKTEENGKKGIGHFETPDDKGVLQNSKTVQTGFIYSKRIFKIG